MKLGEIGKRRADGAGQKESRMRYTYDFVLF